MQINHRVSIVSSPDIQRELACLGVTVGDRGLVSFDVEESRESWPEIEKWVARRDALDIVSAKFSKEEIAVALWLELEPEWQYGYPQPDEDDFGYLKATYDLSDYCKRCGFGRKQVAPFQMKSEPKWGRRSILQLNWVFDECFVTPDAWTLAFKPHGIECRPVLNTMGSELRSVVQLVARGEVGVVTDGLATEEAACSRCGRTKYLPVARGRFPALTDEPSAAMVKTKEYFGSGGAADKSVLVSQAVAHSVTSNNLRGAAFRPVETARGAWPSRPRGAS